MKLEFVIETGKSVAETRVFIDQKILARPEATMLLAEHRWEGNVLHASGSLGTGTMTVEHGKVLVDLELSAFGQVARNQIERTLNEQFKRLSQ